MNGAEALLRTAAAHGVGVCFANAGTSELALVAALDRVDAIRPILGLHENVVTGAADGYGRIAGKPAIALLHLGPGLANGIANLHNARRARTPLLAVVGEHASWHIAADSPITMDVELLARAAADSVRVVRDERMSMETAAAWATAAGGRVSALIVPGDQQAAEVGDHIAMVALSEPGPPDAAAVDEAALLLRGEGPSVLLLGGDGLSARSQRAAERIAAGTGCRLLAEVFPAKMERGGALPTVAPLPYPPPAARPLLDVASVVLAGAAPPVTMFGYPGEPSALVARGTAVCDLGRSIPRALEELAERVGAPAPAHPAPPPARPSGRLEPESIAAAIAWAQPEGAVVVDESVTTGRSYHAASAGSAPHTYLRLTGGAIGFGPPAALGAAIAAPERPVLGFQADGSALYTLQALWGQAREGCNVTTVLCDNGGYRILRTEMMVAGLDPGASAGELLDFGSGIDWVKLAEGFGVPAVSVATADELADRIAWSAGEPGPNLIHVRF